MAQRLCLLISPAYIIFDHMCEESRQEFLDCKSKGTGVRQQLLKQYKDVIPIDINNIVEDLNFHWHSHCTQPVPWDIYTLFKPEKKSS